MLSILHFGVCMCWFGYIFIVCGDPAKAGAQSTCVGNPGAPTCDAATKVCKCGTKASCMGSTTKKSAPICFKKGKELACACGDQGNVYSLRKQT